MIASWRSYTLGAVSASVFFTLVLTLTAGQNVHAGGHETPTGDAPVYMITVGRIVSEGDIGPYTLKMLEAADGRGMESLAFNSDFKVFEGSWAHDGFLSVERAPSMEALESFWNSSSYQDAIPLRDGILEIDFAIAIEGR